MNATTRAARTLQSLPDGDAAAILDVVQGEIRQEQAEVIAPGLWSVTTTVGAISYRVMFGAPEGITTTIISVSLAEPP